MYLVWRVALLVIVTWSQESAGFRLRLRKHNCWDAAGLN